MQQTTISISHKNGKTIVSSGFRNWDFGKTKLFDSTIIASLIFQTVYAQFERLEASSEDFTIDLTMDYTVND